MNAHLLDELVVAELTLTAAPAEDQSRILRAFLRDLRHTLADHCDIDLQEPNPLTRRGTLEFRQTSYDVRWKLHVHVLSPDLLSTEPLVRLIAWVAVPMTPDGRRSVQMDVRAFEDAWHRLQPQVARCLHDAAEQSAGRLTLVHPQLPTTAA